MKKILSLLLVAVMMVSVLPVAYAANSQDYTAGTAVVYTAANNTDYSITVPASLDPGKSGTVTLSGSWPSDTTVKVTADSSVTLTNSINANDQKTLAVTFAGMEKAGDNSAAQTYTESVSVAAMPSDALFGTWDGKFNYYVELVEETTQTPINFTLKNNTTGESKTYQAEEGMTWGEFVESDYNDGSFSIPSADEDNEHEYVYYNGNQIGCFAYNVIVGGDISYMIGDGHPDDTLQVATRVNNVVSSDIRYEYDLSQSRDIQFTYVGDGELLGWEFVEMEEGVDYTIADEGDIYIIITIDNGYKGTITVNAIVEE